MPKTVTSKADILQGACGLAQEYGLSSISIRGVANACGVSSGTIYNYFPSRDELVAAVAADYFDRAFYEGFCHPEPDENYLAYCNRLYAALDERLLDTGSDWLSQFQSLEPGARQAGRRRMDDLLGHIRSGLQSVLERDGAVRPGALVGDMDAPHVCAFTQEAMFDGLRRGRHDCRTLLALLERALY